MSDAFKDLAVLTKIHPNTSQNNRLALVTLITLGLGVFNTLFLLVTAVNSSRLANRPLPAFVQLADGKSLEVKALEGKNRPPQLIKNFTTTTLTKLFTWQRYLPLTDEDDPRKPKLDPGIPVEAVESKLLIPTSVWGASFGLEENFRKEFIGKSLAPLLTELGILQGKSEVALSILDVQPPVEVKSEVENERLWKVKVVANLIVRSTTDVPEKLVPMNKTIYLRAIAPAVPITPNQPGGDLAQVVAMAASAGLQIYAIEAYQTGDTKPLQPSIEPVPSTNPTNHE
jgi:hypothetical protein